MLRRPLGGMPQHEQQVLVSTWLIDNCVKYKASICSCTAAGDSGVLTTHEALSMDFLLVIPAEPTPGECHYKYRVQVRFSGEGHTAYTNGKFTSITLLRKSFSIPSLLDNASFPEDTPAAPLQTGSFLGPYQTRPHGTHYSSFRVLVRLQGTPASYLCTRRHRRSANRFLWVSARFFLKSCLALIFVSNV